MAHHRIELRHQIEIGADAETIYDLISDVTRIGDWSPECVAAAWTEGEPGVVGSRLTPAQRAQAGVTDQGIRHVNGRGEVIGWTKNEDVSFKVTDPEQITDAWNLFPNDSS